MDDSVLKAFKKSLEVSENTCRIDKKSIAQNKDIEIHQGTMCDNCGASPILGTRYVCLTCENYELCEYCEGDTSVTLSINEHPRNHPLVKIKVAVAKFKK